MSFIKPAVKRAQEYNMTEIDCQILSVIALWFNGYTFEFGDPQKCIARTEEPALQRLVDELWGWDSDYADRIDRLSANGFFQQTDPYLAGSKCQWKPTEQCLSMIEELFRDVEEIYPPWLEYTHNHPPLCRDGQEKIPHRKGVDLAAGERAEPLDGVVAVVL